MTKAELKEISKAMAEVAAMKGELTGKRNELDVLTTQVFSATAPTTREAMDLRSACSMQLHKLVREAATLVKGIDARMQAVIAAQAEILSGLSTDDAARQEINNTRGEIRSMQAEYDDLEDRLGSIMQEGARNGKLEHVQELKLQEMSERMRFLRGSIDAKSGHVVAAQEGLMHASNNAVRQEIEPWKGEIKG